MNLIVTADNYKGHNIGSKAKRLFEMKDAGINVPEFICIKKGCTKERLEEFIDKMFLDCRLFSVRSSASAEDGEEFSFAGQFETFLNVEKADVFSYAERCFDSVNAPQVKTYCKNTGVNYKEIEVTVIIQQMIAAEISGVIFTANPQGLLNETVIAIGRGTGNNVVEDKTAVTQYFHNNSDCNYYYETQEDSPILEQNTLNEAIKLSKTIRELFGGYPDIEFAIKNEKIFILQARPITSLKHDKMPLILDSSNISESYPGVSSPMTISFVREVYYLVFKSCIRRLTRNDGTAEKLENVLHNMVDSANGRIYYRISGWYDVIMLLPFSSKIIPVWQEMLGVKDKTVTRSSEHAGFAVKLRVLISFFQLIFTNKKKMKWLNDYFENIFSEYKPRIDKTSEPKELFDIYAELKNALASVWDLTLVNDMYSFIFTGLLKKSFKHKYPDDYEVTTNMYISGKTDLESLKPLKMLSEIKKQLKIENCLNEIEDIKNENSYLCFINKGGKAAKLMEEYIFLYGDRCPYELKLETKTYRTNPELFIKMLIELPDLTELNEPKTKKLSKLKGISKLFAEKAGDGILLRESSRIARGKIFGLVREIILKTAEQFYKEKRIEEVIDIFYLTFEELEQAINDNNILLKEKISERKNQFSMYDKLPPYSRLIFSERVFDKNPMNINSQQFTLNKNKIKGIPCSSGVVEGEVVMIDEITNDIDAKGKIIVAKMTDPGWVFLITQAAGIISEKGSLLSHTAIISRELQKPAVVGVDKIFDTLQNGDFVRINGGTGEIEILRS